MAIDINETTKLILKLINEAQHEGALSQGHDQRAWSTARKKTSKAMENLVEYLRQHGK